MNAWIETNGQSVLTFLRIIVLILIVIMLIRIIMILGKLTNTGTKLNNSLDIVNDYLDDMKTPVRALVNVSMSVEALRSATEASTRNMFDSITNNFNKIIEQLKKIWQAIMSQSAKSDEGLTVVKVEPASDLPDDTESPVVEVNSENITLDHDLEVSEEKGE